MGLRVRVRVRLVRVGVADMVEVVVEQFGILILRHFAVRNANALAQQQHAHQGSG